MSDTDRQLLAIAYLAVLVAALLLAVEAVGLVGGQFLLPWRYVFGTLLGLFSHPGRLAWPAPYRSELPADMTFGFIFAAVVAVAFTAAGWVLLHRFVRSKTPPAARWENTSDLTALLVKGPEKGRLVLGRHDGRLIAATDRQSTVVVGPTQYGKSSGLVIPAILEWAGSVVSTSVKPDVYLATRERREQLGEVKVFDPLGRTRLPTATWSPVAEAVTWPRARATAALLMQTGWEQARLDKEPHWRREAARFLAPLLLGAYHGHRSLGDVLRWIHTDKDGLGEIRRDAVVALRDSGDPHWREAVENLEATWNKDAKYWASVYSTLDAGLDPWQDPGVVSATSIPDITADWLLSGNNTLYIVAPGRDPRQLENLVSALVMQLIDDALLIAAQAPGQRLDPPMLFALDEVANIAPIPNLAEVASTGLGPGILLLTVLQDYAQAREKWGPERASSILAQHTCKVFCSGISDPDTLDYVRRITGDQVVERTSRTRHFRGSSTTVAPHHQPLAPHHQPLAPPTAIRQADQDTALLINGRHPPAWIHLRPWWREPSLNGTAKSRWARFVPTAVILAMVLGGCGATRHASTSTAYGVAPSSPIVAGAPPTPTTTASASTRALTETATPTAAASQKPVILAVTRRFADAYLAYQFGRLTPIVRRELRATCTPQFAAYLLASPVNIPPTVTRSLEPSQITSLTYVPPNASGPQPVLVHYVGGMLKVQVIQSTGGWRVTGLT